MLDESIVGQTFKLLYIREKGTTFPQRVLPVTRLELTRAQELWFSPPPTPIGETLDQQDQRIQEQLHIGKS